MNQSRCVARSDAATSAAPLAHQSAIVKVPSVRGMAPGVSLRRQTYAASAAMKAADPSIGQIRAVYW